MKLIGHPKAFAQTSVSNGSISGTVTDPTGVARVVAVSVRMNTLSMSIIPKAIQDLLDELEASKQSRLRAWSVLQKLRMVLSEMGSVAIPPPAQKTFDAEGEGLGTCFEEIPPSPE